MILKFNPTAGLSLKAPGVALVFGFSFLGQALGQTLLEQSPINITSANTTYNSNLSSLNFAYGSTSLSVVDTGSPGLEKTIRAEVPSGAGSLTVGSTSYNLLQFHFHAEAEHAINGVRSKMEIHMVHQDSNSNLLVVGRQIIEGATDNALLAPIFSSLPAVGTPLSIASFDLSGLIPTSLTSFRYDGSLTTSPYTEGVKWVVMSEPLVLSQSQIAAFESLFPQGDSRELQDLHGRVIQTDVAGFAVVPEPGSWAVIAGFGLGFFALGRRHLKKAA